MAGLLKKKRERGGAEIPTSSMADIAFLLLIFFLVTTTIDVDTGIGMTLPPKLEDDQTPPPVKERNMLKILVNQQGQVLIEEQPSSVAQIREEIKEHVLNRGQNPDLSESPDKAIVSLKTTRATPYSVYIGVLDEIWMAYFELWDAEARSLGYQSYETYKEALEGTGEENVVRDRIPAALSIAEPDEGEE